MYSIPWLKLKRLIFIFKIKFMYVAGTYTNCQIDFFQIAASKPS